MANAVITVLEADGSTQTDVTVLDVGRQAAAASKSVAMATEDKAVFDAVAADLDAINTNTPALGAALAANSIPTTLATDDVLQTGLSVFRSFDLDETEEDVKTSAGKLYKIRAANRTTSALYLKLYNATAANVSVGTTTPIDTIILPAAGTAGDACVVTEAFGGRGLTFGTALSMAVTTGLADNDTGAPSANAAVVTAYYI